MQISVEESLGTLQC